MPNTHLSEGRRLVRSQLQAPGLYAAVTLAAALQLTAKSAQFLRLDPGGAHRNVDLPGPDEGIADNDGLMFSITNTADAAENLVVRNPAGDTVVTISQNERAIVVGAGGAVWAHLGIETIALS